MSGINWLTYLLAKAYTDKKASEVPAVIQYKGVTTTELYDGATTNPITINGNSYTAVDGDVVFYQSTAYAYDGSVWQATMSLAQIITALEDLEDKIGNLDDLTTETKTSVVAAINELVTALGAITDGQSIDSFSDVETALENICDDANIDSFADVVTALGNKVDKVPGKVLSANDYTNEDKAIVGGVTAALATKQNAEDNNLTTTSKQVVGAINEVNSNLTDLQEWTDTDTKTVTGNPITVEDAAAVKAEAMSMTIVPDQNLHGYDHPWVGGAGKNKLPLTVANLKTYNTSGTWSDNVYTVNGVTFTVNTDDGGNVTSILASGTASAFAIMLVGVLDVSAGDKLNGCPAGGDTSRYCINTYNTALSEFYGRDTGDGLTFDSNINDVNVFLSIQNGYAIPTGGITFLPMIRLSTETDATFAPYTNICPISGLTSADVETEGKNQLKVTATTTGIYSVDDNGVITVNGLSNGDGLIVGYVNPKSNERYILTGCPEGGGVDTYRLDARLVSDPSVPIGGSGDTGTGGEFNASEQYYVFLRCPNGVNVSNKKFYPMIRLASEQDATFVPYQKHTVTIVFGQTVYGGNVVFETGKVRVTHGFEVLDGSVDEGWYLSSGNKRVNSNIIRSAVKSPASNTEVANIISSQFVAVTANDAYNGVEGICVDSSGVLGVHNGGLDVVMTIDSWETYLASNPLQVCYELATPFELTLTPAQLELLKGYNTVTANGATITLTYQPDNLAREILEQVDEKIAVVDGEKQDKTDNSLTTTAKTVVGGINELKSSLMNYKVLAYVTTDGVKTASQLLAELYPSIPTIGKYLLVFNGGIYNMSLRSESSAVFTRVMNVGGTMYMGSIEIKSNGANWMIVNIASNGSVTVTDSSSDVIASGKRFELAY